MSRAIKRQRHWATIGERGTLGGMLFMVWLRRFGDWPFQLVLWPVILWYYLTHRTARRASQDYLSRLDPPLAGHPVRLRARSVRHFLCFGRSLMDKVAAWNGEYPPSRLSGAGVSHFTKAVDEGQGGLIVVAHHGNLDIVNALSECHPALDLIVIMHTPNARKFNALLERATGRRRPEILEVNEISPSSAQRLDARIRAGGFVVIAADRVPPRQGRTRELDFLDAKAPFPEGPFLLASLLRCRVYRLACVRQSDGFLVDFDLLDDASQVGRRERAAWISAAMQRHCSDLAWRVQRHPLQWFNFFPFWTADETNDHVPPR
ncbi:glycosyl transferase [Halomonas denitrificans]|uniref:LpxL/LpxP family acyltransferase n=1 Tax=Halomonas denitrificans TaxID=370769 RepID=UPI001C999ACF|nr:glycosyl transferase [Halomonas denitrificans]MBY5970184.1 glycosyl transferase [Halomonas denitrificans]